MGKNDDDLIIIGHRLAALSEDVAGSRPALPGVLAFQLRYHTAS